MAVSSKEHTAVSTTDGGATRTQAPILVPTHTDQIAPKPKRTSRTANMAIPTASQMETEGSDRGDTSITTMTHMSINIEDTLEGVMIIADD